MGKSSPRLEQDLDQPRVGFCFIPAYSSCCLAWKDLPGSLGMAPACPGWAPMVVGGTLFSLGSSETDPDPAGGPSQVPSVWAASPWSSFTAWPLPLPPWMVTCASVMESWNGLGWKGP